MEFNNYLCPVCNKQFTDGDDIVVCPECGAPHHRECYEIENRCAFEDKHGENFDYKTESEENKQNNTNEEFSEDGKVICPKCKTENEMGTFYCNKCGYPVGLQNTEFNQNNQNTQYNNPMGGQQFNTANPFAAVFDPMAGVSPDEDMGDGVTAGEISKFVKNNTPYFIRVFKNIKDFSKGKFNFCAFIFSGGYFLYRKMYMLGALFTTLHVLLIIAETYIMNFLISGHAKSVLDPSGDSYSYSEVFNSVQNLDSSDQFLIAISGLCVMLTIAMKVILGLYANKWYFKHCKSKISMIKKETDEPGQFIEKVGGVNTALAMSMLGAVVLLDILPIPVQIFI